MDYMRYNGLSKSVIYQSYIPFTPYKAKLYYPKKNKYFSPKKMSRNEIIAIPKSYRFPLIKLNNSTSLSPIKVLTRSMSSTSSFSSNNYNTLSNISKKTINSKLTNSPNHRSIIQPTYSHRIYSPNSRPNNENIIYNLTSANANNYRNNAKVSVSPTNYNSIAMVRPNSIGYNKNFARVTPINCVNTTNISYSKVPINQSVRIITSKKENPVKKKYYIKSPRYTSNSIPILSTQKVTTYSNPQYTTYSTSQTYSNSTPILSTKQLVTNSNPQKTKISTPQISSSSNPILYTQKVTSNSNPQYTKISTPQITSRSIPILYTQKVTSNSNPQYTTYSTPQISSNSNPILSTKKVTTYSKIQNDNISTPQNYSYYIPIISTQQVTKNLNPKNTTKSTPQISSDSTPILPTQATINLNQQYTTYSTPQISSESIQQNNDNVYNSENKTDNYQIINNNITEDNSYNENYNYDNTNIDVYKASDEIVPGYNDVSQENVTSQENKEIYQEPIETKNNYLINSPNINEEKDRPPVYHSYIHKSPEITYNKNLFSPIQSPLANYETQSFNGDENVNIEEILRLKEENGRMKQKLQDLEYKYQAETAQSNELRIQIQQLSPLKDKLSEIESLKEQLSELNLLKTRINELEAYKQNIEERELNELRQEIDFNYQNEKSQIMNYNQEVETETNTELINTLAEQKNNTQQLDLEKEIEAKKEEFEIMQKTEPLYVKGEILHSIEELTMIITKIKTRRGQLTLNLIYKATADSDRAAMFHKKCDKAKRSIVLIETDDGRRFGGYTSVSWNGKCLNKIDEDSFIFSLDNMKIYESIKGKKAIGCYPKFGPIFLGCQIRIYDEAFKNGGSTFKKGINFHTDEDFVLTGGERLFKVKEIEVYEVIDE